MTAAGLKVLAPGLHTTVQDLGRPGYLAIGVPPSGALDGFSFRFANALVGNDPEAPALEVLLSGPTLEIAADTVRVALAGADASLAIERWRIVTAGQSVTLSRGAVFQVVVGRRSACCYLAAGLAEVSVAALTEWPLNVRVMLNSPSLWPTMFSVM